MITCKCPYMSLFYIVALFAENGSKALFVVRVTTYL